MRRSNGSHIISLQAPTQIHHCPHTPTPLLCSLFLFFSLFFFFLTHCRKKIAILFLVSIFRVPQCKSTGELMFCFSVIIFSLLVISAVRRENILRLSVFSCDQVLLREVMNALLLFSVVIYFCYFSMFPFSPAYHA